MKRSLSWKLAAVVTLGIAVVHSVFGYLRVEREVEQFEAETRRDHATMAHALGVAATSTASRVGVAEAIRLLEDADLETDHADIRWTTDAPPPRPTGPGHFAVESTVQREDGHRILVSAVGLVLGEEQGVLQIRESLEAEEAYVRDTVERTVLMTVVLVVLCFAILMVAGWSLVQQPMKALVGKVQRVGQGDLSGPVVVPQRDELGTLADAINMMCEELGKLQHKNEQESSAKVAALSQLRHADRLSTVGTLASGIAHELGTPLNVVSARAKMIAKRQSVGDEAVDDAEVIVDQTQRMTQIIRQLLDFARRRKPSRTEEDLTSICEQTLQILSPLAKKLDVELELVPEGPRTLATVDASQLQQVITNLVMNGIQCQLNGGVVRIRISLSADPPPAGSKGPYGEHISIAVEDEGDGIPEDAKAQLFEPFFTTKEVGQGTGLGLSVAYGIVQEHDGWIGVESEAGRGSCFTVHLPRETE